ncbi:bolA homolog 1 (E. coli) [Seminavis robusta]|uniref:BolA homolog 1 (E. coli) n=1 Tax=Seminavis robusta TaxID=568900 RepID=A0A9N8DGJ3_9STRA|nr:bolA homolog 1 (E. coli) [Seminavis robusta]|eukprot:Sro132_g062410.1 bolA homolog 1 (E. coli) (137) ;mRNA; r:12585-13240
MSSLENPNSICSFGYVWTIIIMFSASARAFSLAATRPAARFPYLVARMSSAGEPDTTIVDVCKQKIEDALGPDKVEVTGAYDDPNGSHISVIVVSDKFEGKRAVQRQQMVYKALWEELKGPVHAVDSMICKTPDEA